MLAGFLAAGAMVATGCISAGDARKSVDLPVLIAIAASFGVGKALEQSGVAKLFAGMLVEGTRSLGPSATLAAIYLGTMVLNELISNNAAAALSFPFCLESARLLGVSERPFIMAVTLAASYAFASPDRLSDAHDGLRARRIPFHRLHARRDPFESAHVHRRGHPDPADLAVLGRCVSVIPSFIPFQLEHPLLQHALCFGSEPLPGRFKLCGECSRGNLLENAKRRDRALAIANQDLCELHAHLGRFRGKTPAMLSHQPDRLSFGTTGVQ